MRLDLSGWIIRLQRKVCFIVISGFCIVTLFAQVPTGAKENIHLKIEQENRLNFTEYQEIGITSSRTKEYTWANGALIEIALHHVTFGATFLNEGSTDLDLGYEYPLSKSINLHPFVGYEMKGEDTGLTLGAKLNKNIEMFENISIGLFAGVRYSAIENERNYSYNNSSISHGYLGGSAGIYCMIYDYRRPTIRRDW